MSLLFSPIRLRGLECRNRVFVSPMCQYSSRDGMPNDWHLVHLGSRAVGGAGLVMTEAAAVSPQGRISPDDLGIWSDPHGEALGPIVRFIKGQGAAAGIQLAHAGRKASTAAPFKGGAAVPEGEGGWKAVAPSAVPFGPAYQTPHVLTPDEIEGVVAGFAAAAVRGRNAGFDLLEIHAAHGYLLHQFLSPLSNRREDAYGGSFDNRVRLTVAVARRVRAVLPDGLPVLVRISATDWAEGGWTPADSIELARRLKAEGVDMIDCSSGGLVPGVRIPTAPGYQSSFAADIRREAGIATAAVGLITSPEQAEHLLVSGQADAVLLAREMLRNPYWPLMAARRLKDDVRWPEQYERAK
ncbi:MAG: NADH:flavin oxidoreductase/NADH oxidase [Acidobacteria bacterium]|nr:MAG: NADH:flavin oxidoreductase/NADH oxidase [Acidobacteriota bacterium]RPJ75710.1 MAG: NADH:flavin oxidoreductase/NADH oxidase [Acidobacteriota bacterium]